MTCDQSVSCPLYGITSLANTLVNSSLSNSAWAPKASVPHAHRKFVPCVLCIIGLMLSRMSVN